METILKDDELRSLSNAWLAADSKGSGSPIPGVGDIRGMFDSGLGAKAYTTSAPNCKMGSPTVVCGKTTPSLCSNVGTYRICGC